MNAAFSYNSSYTITCRASQLSTRKMTNLYNVLNLESENVGFDVIKRAYRNMALRHHPDVCPSSKWEESTRMFVELSKAYEILSDPIMRQKYDQQLGPVGFMDREEVEGARRNRGRRFEREVWMNQINELEIRSAKRMTKKRMDC